MMPVPHRLTATALLPALTLLLAACHSPAPPVPAPEGSPELETLRVVTLNTGSGKSVDRLRDQNAGYGPPQAEVANRWYGNGLAWPAALRDVRAFLQQVDADIVGLQEVFHSGHCADIPAPARAGFVCETWQPGDATVAQEILGDNYQVACHPGKPDKCLAVHRRLGRIEGCDEDFCRQGLEGLDDDVCGSGNRVAAANLLLVSGSSLRVVHMHGTSGATRGDTRCRRGQIEAIAGDKGAAAEFGVILGDFNTDPGRVTWLDPAARALRQYARPPGNYRFMTDVGFFVRPTFLSFLNIDHILSAGMSGDCWYAGRTPNTAPVTELVYLDHTAVVCDLRTVKASRLHARG